MIYPNWLFICFKQKKKVLVYVLQFVKIFSIIPKGQLLIRTQVLSYLVRYFRKSTLVNLKESICADHFRGTPFFPGFYKHFIHAILQRNERESAIETKVILG